MASDPPRLYIALYTDADVHGKLARQIRARGNARDFEPLAKEYWNTGKDHWGIVVSQKLPIGTLLRRVLKMLDIVDADQMKNCYRALGEFK